MAVTGRTHGADAAQQAAADAVALFAAEPIRDPVALARLYASVGGFSVDAGAAAGGVAGTLAAAGVFASNGEARRMIENGGLTINGDVIRDPAAVMPPALDGQWWEVRIGKRRRVLGRIAS